MPNEDLECFAQLVLKSWIAIHRVNRALPEVEHEQRRCPLLWCRSLFPTEAELDCHIKTCARLGDGEYWCPYCHHPEHLTSSKTSKSGTRSVGRKLLKPAVFEKAKNVFRKLGRLSCFSKPVQENVLNEAKIAEMADHDFLPELEALGPSPELSSDLLSEAWELPVGNAPEHLKAKLPLISLPVGGPEPIDEYDDLIYQDMHSIINTAGLIGVASPAFSPTETQDIGVGMCGAIIEPTKVESMPEVEATPFFEPVPLPLQTDNDIFEALQRMSRIHYEVVLERLHTLSEIDPTFIWPSVDIMLQGGMAVLRDILRGVAPKTFWDLLLFSFLAFTIAAVLDRQHALYSGELYDDVLSWSYMMESEEHRSSFLQLICHLWSPQSQTIYQQTPPLVPQHCIIGHRVSPISGHVSRAYHGPTSHTPLNRNIQTVGASSPLPSCGGPTQGLDVMKTGLAMRLCFQYMEGELTLRLRSFYSITNISLVLRYSQLLLGGSWYVCAEQSSFANTIQRHIIEPLKYCYGLEAFHPVATRASALLQRQILGNIFDVEVYLLQDGQVKCTHITLD